MIYTTEQRDLFSVGKDYHLAHCVSADFKLGAGIAAEFNNKYKCRNRLFQIHPGSLVSYWDSLDDHHKGLCVITDPVYNLVTKRNYWDKPTLVSVTNALLWMREDTEIRNIKKIAMPKIGCGLDKLDWYDVSLLIKETFADTDVEILVCYQ